MMTLTISDDSHKCVLIEALEKFKNSRKNTKAWLAAESLLKCLRGDYNTVPQISDCVRLFHPDEIELILDSLFHRGVAIKSDEHLLNRYMDIVKLMVKVASYGR